MIWSFVCRPAFACIRTQSCDKMQQLSLQDHLIAYKSKENTIRPTMGMVIKEWNAFC